MLPTMMSKSKIKQDGDHLLAQPNNDDEEFEVAEILLRLGIDQHEDERGCFPIWGCKRIRSASPSAPTSPSVRSFHEVLSINGDTPCLETSPSCSRRTPHLQPDTHPHVHHEPPKIKDDDDDDDDDDEDRLLKLEDELTKCSADLRKAIGKVKVYYARLNDFNTKLKDRKAEYSRRTENHKVEYHSSRTENQS